MAKVKAQSTTKKKKKSWVQINAPKVFGRKKIGETHVYFPEDAIGKRIEQNLMTLTGDMKKQNISVKFLINKVSGTLATTEVIAYKMTSSFIKRLVRRRRDKIEISKVFSTKDNLRVRIKPLIITNARTRGSVEKNIRKQAEALVQQEAKKLTYERLIESIITYKFQNTIKNILKKVYPLRSFDIRQFVLESDHDSIVQDESEEKTEDKPKEETKKSEKVEEKTEKKPEEKIETKEEKTKAKKSEKAEDTVEKKPKKETKKSEEPKEKAEEVEKKPEEKTEAKEEKKTEKKE